MPEKLTSDLSKMLLAYAQLGEAEEGELPLGWNGCYMKMWVGK